MHPTLQSEQVGVLPVEGVVSIVDELQNPDGVWVRIGRDSLAELAPNHSEGWCLQYNQHLNKTLMVPVAAEEGGKKKPTPTTMTPPGAPIVPTANTNSKMAPIHGFSSSSSPSPAEPTLRQKKSNDERNKILSRGPGYYRVVKCGPSGHNIRCQPRLNAVPVGMAGLGDTLRAVAVKEDRQTGETWLQLARETADAHCLSPGEGGDACWTLAVSATHVTHLESQLAAEEKRRAAEAAVELEAEMAMMQRQVQMAAMQQIRMSVTGSGSKPDPATSQQQQSQQQQLQKMMGTSADSGGPIQQQSRPTPTRRKSEGVMVSRNSPVDFGISKRPSDQKPTPPPRHSLSLSAPRSASPSRRTPSPATTSSAPGSKPSFFQKLFEKGSRRGSSASPPSVRRPMPPPPPPPPSVVNKDIPPELQGVSVKELVKVIGESRANGNGVTPPGTPGSMRRSSRSVSPQVCSSLSSSSPVSIAHAASSQPIAVASGGDVQLARQDSSQSDTSALISSLTRDLSQSPGETSGGSPASISLRSEAATIPRRSSRSPGRRRHHHQHAHQQQQQQLQMIDSFDSGAASALAKSLTSIAGSSEPARPKEATTTSSSNKTTSPSSAGMTVVEQEQSKEPPNSNRHRVEVTIEKAEQEKHEEAAPMFIPGGGPIKEAMSPSVAESIRSVFAAFIWHEGIVHDAMAAAAFLKFHPSLSKEEELLAVASVAQAAASSTNPPPVLSKRDRILQRHSVEVISTAYLKSKQVHNSSPIDSLEKSAMNANTNRNLSAQKQQQQHNERIEEEEPQPLPEAEDEKEIAEATTTSTTAVVASKLPPTMRLFVLLWEEVRSYCHHAILQQVILGSPLAQLPSKKSEKKDRKSKKRRKTTASSANVFGDFEKRDANEPWPSIAAAADDKENKDGSGAKEAFIQNCDMCGLHFQVSLT